MDFKVTLTRSLVKAITFRILILIADGFIVFAITHRYDVALAVIVLSNISSTVFYFLHERVWNGVRWGKIRTEVSKI